MSENNYLEQIVPASITLIEDLRDTIKHDTFIDELALDKSCTDTAGLHGKYVGFLAILKREYFVRQKSRDVFAKRLLCIYRNWGGWQEEVVALQKAGLNVEFAQQKISNRDDTNIVISANADIMKIDDVMNRIEIAIEMVDKAIYSLNNRQWIIKNLLEIQKSEGNL